MRTPTASCSTLRRAVWLLLAVVVASAQPTRAQDVDFSGRWLRNAELSQFWREPYDAAPRRSTNRWEDERIRRLQETVEQQLALAEQIELRQTARDLEFDIAGRGLRIFYFDRDHVRQTPWAEKIEASMDWEGSDIIIDEVTETGSRITERLTKLNENQMAHLFIWQDSELFEQPVSIRSVYDRAPDAP